MSLLALKNTQNHNNITFPDSFSSRITNEWPMYVVHNNSKASSSDFSLIIQKLKDPKSYFSSEQEIESFIEHLSMLDFEIASEQEVTVVTRLLINYAKEGVSNEFEKKVLEEEVNNLFYEGKACLSQMTYKSYKKGQIDNLCFKKAKTKGGLKKGLKKFGNFIKKHKKAIVTTVVVVAAVVAVAAVTIVAVNALGTAAIAEGAAATGAALGATAGAIPSNNNSLKEKITQPDPLTEQLNLMDPAESYPQPQSIKAPASEISDSEVIESLCTSHLPHFQAVNALTPYEDDFKNKFQVCETEIDYGQQLFAGNNHNLYSHAFYESQIEAFEKDIGLSAGGSASPQSFLASNSLSVTSPSSLQHTIDYCRGFKNGFWRGFKDSGSNLKHFGSELIHHPINTLDQVINVVRDLGGLVLNDQWAELSEALSPEGYKLATEWNYLQSEERGELAGYAIGKLGADIVIPGAAAKLVSKGVKGANKLLDISNKLQKVENTLALEGAALENGAQLINKQAMKNLPANPPFLGIIFGKGNFTVEKLVKAGNALDREGLTKAGRGLAKHGGREISVFPKPSGNPAEINLQGQQILETILNHPHKNIVFKENARHGSIIDILSPDVGGARFSSNGDFITFLEP